MSADLDLGDQLGETGAPPILPSLTDNEDDFNIVTKKKRKRDEPVSPPASAASKSQR